MTIFLTGGTGFIGRNWIRQFLKTFSDHSLIVFVRNQKFFGSDFASDKRVRFSYAESLDKVDLSDLKEVDVVLHLAAHAIQYPYDTLERCVENNVYRPLALFKKACDAGVKKIVVTGSYFEYGYTARFTTKVRVDDPLLPSNNYSISKAASFNAFLDFALKNKVILHYHRLFQVYGEGEALHRFYPSLVAAAREGRNFKMTEGNQVRDFISVESVTDHLIHSALEEVSDKKYNAWISNLGSGYGTRLSDFAFEKWQSLNAKGKLLIGALESRPYEMDGIIADLDFEMIL
ncbi:NAD-dependent epimerase/dehydratase family protein [Cyclobacterium xiamenense]|uniref:NAD-dependent epimerase/dehydratase family protein n=1 Tax=Cyclobacterium xiamenense TaxID=1297121 RepID=UPI0012BA2A19|nr:NAD(P)-dependent oxidoreductase [Cyclobacterium xiamenense]